MRKDTAADAGEPLEHRLERVSRNLSEAAAELQRLVDLLWKDLRPGEEGPPRT
jgi:hypothetical protein